MYTAQMLSLIAEARSTTSRAAYEMREGQRLAALLEAACAAIAAETPPPAAPADSGDRPRAAECCKA